MRVATLSVFFCDATASALPPGLHYEHRTLVSRAGPMSVHLLSVDPSRIVAEIRLAEDRVLHKELTTSIVRRTRAAAAVNGGFFVVDGEYAGDPDGFFARGGRILSEPVDSRRRHPRTAVGFHPDGRWILVVVDGRQPELWQTTLRRSSAFPRPMTWTAAGPAPW